MLIRTINHQIHYIYITYITIQTNTREIINHYQPLSTNPPMFDGEIPRQVTGVGARPIVSEPTPRP